MATRHHQHAAAAPQPANRGAAVQAGKQKAAAGRPGGGANRLLFGDIGNVLLDGINRPITRSFAAQLLKKAQADPKNGIAVPGAAAPRPQAAKIVTASDDNRKTSEDCSAPKDACIDDIDIDKLDGDNELAVVDYIEDIYKFYKVAQHECSQTEISPKKRAILTDWLVEVAHKFELMPESLYLTIYIIDRFLSMQVVPRRELQLVGIVAMLIACKYEEILAPKVSDFITITNNSYSRQQILSMEKKILISMAWNLTVPTPYVFLVRFAKAAGGDKELETMAFFFGEMALLEYELVTLLPSLVAASAVYAARCTLKKSPTWTETLMHHTGFIEAELMEPSKVLVMAHAAAPDSKLKEVYNKYSCEQYGRVALHPPAVAAPQRLA